MAFTNPGLPYFYKPFGPYAAWASSEAIGFWADHATDVSEPARTWRSTGTTINSEWWMCDAGASLAFDVLIAGCNFATVKVETGADGISWSNIGTFTVALDPRTGRRRAFIASNTTSRFLRLSPQTAPDGGAAYWEIEVATAVPQSSKVAFADRPSFPLQFTRGRAHEVMEYIGGGSEVYEAASGDIVEITLSGQWRTLIGINMWSTFATLVGTVIGDNPFFFALNLIDQNVGGTSVDGDAYLVQRIADIQVDQSRWLMPAAVTLREVR